MFFSKAALFAALATIADAGVTNLATNPQCTDLKASFFGTPVSVDVDGFSVFGIPASTPGDMSIVSTLFSSATSAPPGVGIQNFGGEVICILDETFDPNHPAAPTCFYEFDLDLCVTKKFYPWIKNETAVTAISVDEAVKQGFLPKGSRDRNLLRGDGDEDNEMVVDHEEDARIHETEARQDKAINGACVGTYRKGKFTAHGAGPTPIAITGGTEGFFGAFGQFESGNFVFGGTISFTAVFKLCWYPGF